MHMRYHQLSVDGDQRVAVSQDGETYDLTAADDNFVAVDDLLQAAARWDGTIDDVARRLLDDATILDEDEVATDRTVPVDASEVWAAGVTYAISEEAREA